METKTYFASSVPAALEVARKELGNDAMLVGSRPASQESRNYGRLEVTFAYDRREVTAARPAPASDTQASGSDLNDIREQLAALRTAIRTSPLGAAQQDPAQRNAELIVEKLLKNGLQEETARSIAEAAVLRTELTDLAVRNELLRHVRVRPFTPMKAGESRTLAFIGPTGRGKSSSLVKVAIKYGLTARIPTKIYSAGVHQVGAAEQMARYAAIVGVPFNWFETTEALHLALNGEKWQGLTLIDTPGIAPADAMEMGEWERFFRLHPSIEKHLVLRADARCEDVSNMMSRLECLGATHLFFTGLDEVSSFGLMVETAIQSQLPLCFASSGTRIPEDLAVVESAALIESVWSSRAMAAGA